MSKYNTQIAKLGAMVNDVASEISNNQEIKNILYNKNYFWTKKMKYNFQNFGYHLDKNFDYHYSMLPNLEQYKTKLDFDRGYFILTKKGKSESNNKNTKYKLFDGDKPQFDSFPLQVQIEIKKILKKFLEVYNQ